MGFMNRRRIHGAAALLATWTMAGCVTVEAPPTVVNAPASARPAATVPVAQAPTGASVSLKRRVAIGRVTNETRYGRTFLRDGDLDPLGKQASDMLANRLTESGAFLVFERPDIAKLEAELAATGQKAQLAGVDALILGSITEFGRREEGRTGFLSQTKRQVANAKVEVRLVDPVTSLVYFSATGVGEAAAETGSVAGYGSTAAYDQTLNDRAIGAAITDVLNALMNKLREKPWSSAILGREAAGRFYIAGGSRQGLTPGLRLAVYRRGKSVVSAQTGLPIELPAERLATLRVVSFFGDSDTTEGSLAEVVDGQIPASLDNIYVGEEKAPS
jgi:curli biogenesis system outer membrane secretion channel CsgG